MIKLNTPAYATAVKGSVAINWSKVLSEVSMKVVMFNSRKNFLVADEDIQDVVQNTCEKIFLHKDLYDPTKAQLSTWISKIAINCYFDALRETCNRNRLFTTFPCKMRNSEGKLEDYTPEAPDYCTDGEALAAELEGLLTLVLEPLCGTYRKAIRCIVYGVPPKEMLEQLHCSTKNLRPTLSRARKAARNSFVALGII